VTSVEAGPVMDPAPVTSLTIDSRVCQWDGVTAQVTSSGRARWSAAFVAGVVLGWSGSALAEEPTIIWYRSSSGCPNGMAFQARVEARGRSAKIATVGDRVDFVVTLSQEEDEAMGRLERQTADGIVAIREVTGDTCDEVANALAFTLGLVDQRHTEEPGQPPPPPAPKDHEAEQTPPPPANPDPPLRTEPPDAPTAPDPTAPNRPLLGATRLGIGATGRSAVGPRGVWGGAIAVSFDDVALPWRLEAQFARGDQEVELGNFGLQLWTGRVEICPVTVERSVRLAWCGGLELGQLRAHGDGGDGTRSSSGWVAGSVEERIRWPADRPLALEGSFGAFVPLRSYRVVAENPRRLLHRVDAAGLTASLSVTLRLR
jgi:hypothetical protein